MQERHTNREQYFKEQAYTTKKYVIPYLETHMTIDPNTRVLEIGCGEGGNLEPFVEIGCQVTGIDILKNKIENARNFLKANDAGRDNLKLILADIYDVDPPSLGQFDVIIMRDVIEHIPNQEKFMHFVKRFMQPDTLFYLGFPPWLMPFGGHQQGCTNRFLSALPYFHLLPQSMYRNILRWGGESEFKIEGLMQIRATGITVERFKKIIRNENYTIVDESPYLFNPNYEVKFNLKPRKQFRLISSIPYIRDLFSTCYYFILKKGNEEPNKHQSHSKS